MRGGSGGGCRTAGGARCRYLRCKIFLAFLRGKVSVVCLFSYLNGTFSGLLVLLLEGRISLSA